MGDMADLAREQAELVGDWGFSTGHDPETHWLTQFDGPIKITDMETQHIENACAMLERNGNQSHPSYFALIEELENRGLA